MELSTDRLATVARALGALHEEAVFVGGAVAPLLITDPGAAGIRPTDDVDVVVEVTTRRDYYALESRLLARGFRHDTTAGAPVCRWRLDGIPVDVMPTDPAVLGFSNRWYPFALETAERRALPGGAEVRIASPVAFLATKVEAFHSPRRRYSGDLVASHDVEDLVLVLDGRPEVDGEIARAREEVRVFLVRAFSAFLQSPDFADAVEGHLGPGPTGAERARRLLRRLEHLSTR